MKKDKPKKAKPNDYLKQGLDFRDKGDLPAALEAFTRAIELTPDNPDGYIFRVGIYLQLNRPDEALADCNKIVELNPRDYEAYIWRALLYETIDRIDEAVADYNKAISLEPDEPANYFAFAEFFSRLHQNDNAIYNYTKAIEKAPQKDVYYLARANFYSRIAQIDKAQSDYSKAIELAPKSADGYLARAGFYKEQLIPDKLELALKDARKAVELEPDNSYARFQTGLVLLDLHRYSEASQSFNQADRAIDERGHVLMDFYYAWSAGLSAYYQGDDLNQARQYFSGAKTALAVLPADLKQSYNISYIAELLEAYLQLIPLDNDLKNLFNEPAKLSQRTELLDGLRESFSGMLKRSNGLLVEIDILLEAKRDICALLLPIDHPQSVKPEDVPEILSNIEGALKYLKYGHTDEMLGILKENRRRLEASQSFTPELSKAAQMDGLLTFDTTRASVSSKLGEIAEVSRQKQVKISITDKDGHLIEITPLGLPGKMMSSVRAPSAAKAELVNVRDMIMEVRKATGNIIPPTAKEVFLQFIKGNSEVKIEVLVGDKWQGIGIYRPAQLEGFRHSQGDEPVMAWMLLIAFAVCGQNGHPPPYGADKSERRKSRDKFRKQVDDLNRKLKNLLGITDDAIVFDRPSGNYLPVIQLAASRHNTIE